MKIIYATFAIIAITILSIFTFKEDLIYYNYAKYTLKNEINPKENDYYYEDVFTGLEEYKGIEIHNKEELYNTIYYLINSGTKSAKRYFSIDYIDYEKDYNELFTQGKEELNIINNYVHPYNTFDSIEGSLKGYALEITIIYNTDYTSDRINLINNKVDTIINDLITSDMSDREKIRKFHDYIINNTKYDEDFCVLKDQTKCVTTSPYLSDIAYGVLFEKNGICSGYTDLMAIFLDKLNITNYRITNTDANHIWNAVMLDGKWYHLDVTWDDPISSRDILSHDYFLITTEEDLKLEQSHNFNKEIFLEFN